MSTSFKTKIRRGQRIKIKSYTHFFCMWIDDCTRKKVDKVRQVSIQVHTQIVSTEQAIKQPTTQAIKLEKRIYKAKRKKKGINQIFSFLQLQHADIYVSCPRHCLFSRLPSCIRKEKRRKRKIEHTQKMENPPMQKWYQLCIIASWNPFLVPVLAGSHKINEK